MSIEAEQAVVASCIASPASHDVVAGILTAEDFTDPRMRLVYSVVDGFRSAGRPVDPITLSATLETSEAWDSTGGGSATAYIDALSGLSHSYKAVEVYADMLKSATVSRSLRDTLQQIAEIANDRTLSADEKLAQAAAALPTIDTGSSGGFVSYYDAAKKALAKMNDRAQGKTTGLTTGLSNLDEMIGGFEPGTLVIIAGRPSHGKSIYAMQFAQHAAKFGQVPVFSFEMTAANLAERGIASIGGVDFGDMRSAKLDEHMVAKMQLALGHMKAMNLWIDDRANISVDQMCTRARIMARKEKPTLIVADYLTLMSGKGETRTAQTGYISRMLKSLAKELSVPVLCVAQLNRGVDSRTDKRPTISDLRDSGEIEQDADIIMFTYLHEKYDEDTPRKGIGELIVAKQRNGPTGSVFNEFQGRYQRFVPYLDPVPPMKDEAITERPRMSQMRKAKPDAAINSAEGF